MTTTLLVLFAIVLRLAAGTGYLAATLRGRVKPSAVSWFFWGVTPLIAFTVQMHEGTGLQSLVTLALGLGPFAIFAVTLVKNKRSLHFTLTDKACGAMAASGVVLWLLTSNPMLALCFSIIGDICSAVPTIIKSFNRPHTEHALPYFLSSLSMVCTLATIRQWEPANYIFPLYILLINLTFVVLIGGRGGRRWKQLMQRQQRGIQSEFTTEAD